MEKDLELDKELENDSNGSGKCPECSETTVSDGKEMECESLKKERDEYLDGWKRAKADLINYRNDELKRMQEITRFASEDILREVLVVIDSFDLGIASLGDESSTRAGKGMMMIRAQMEDMLKRRGLDRISAVAGTPFDPSVHEAISAVESDKDSGMIIEEVEKGYMLHGKLLRPSRVVVSK
jgi:molecular chaperone GrpE